MVSFVPVFLFASSLSPSTHITSNLEAVSKKSFAEFPLNQRLVAFDRPGLVDCRCHAISVSVGGLYYQDVPHVFTLTVLAESEIIYWVLYRAPPHQFILMTKDPHYALYTAVFSSSAKLHFLIFLFHIVPTVQFAKRNSTHACILYQFLLLESSSYS
jgi:hypothetical protein